MAGDPGGPELVQVSFEQFYRSEHVQLVRLLLKLGASWDEAWDVTQHGYVLALENWDTICNPQAWIRTTIVRAYRQAKGRRAGELPRMLTGGWQPRPHFDKLDHRSEEAGVYRAIASLPPRQAEVMALTYDGFNPAEIAEILSAAYPGVVVTATAVRASLLQARKKLRLLLSGEEVTKRD